MNTEKDKNFTPLAILGMLISIISITLSRFLDNRLIPIIIFIVGMVILAIDIFKKLGNKNDK